MGVWAEGRGRGGEMLGDATKMWSVDAVLFSRCRAISVVVVLLLLPHGNYVCVATCLKFWWGFSFTGVQWCAVQFNDSGFVMWWWVFYCVYEVPAVARSGRVQGHSLLFYSEWTEVLSKCDGCTQCNCEVGGKCSWGWSTLSVGSCF
jgi:hypothetical protein